MCYEKVLGYFISLKETFPYATTFTVIDEHCKAAVVQIAIVFRPISHVVC